MAKLNNRERRLPQDADASRSRRWPRSGVCALDLAYAVRRERRDALLDRRRRAISTSLRRLGIDTNFLARMEPLTPRLPHGIFLVTGPTGAAIHHALFGVENASTSRTRRSSRRRPGGIPDGWHQPDPRESADRADLRAGLRHIVRAGSDVIMWGNPRPRDGRYRIRAGLTGHLVFSTLHTNDRPALSRGSPTWAWRKII